jgi:hypothetical protein
VSLPARSHGPQARRHGLFFQAWVALTLGLSVFSAGCQKDDHPPYATGCLSNCAPLQGVSLGGSTPPSTGGTGTVTDGGIGTLTGDVLALTDDSFVNATLFAKTATVSAVGASVATVAAPWDGVDAYELTGVASLSPNWVSVQPDDAQGDAQLTYQAVATSAVSTADLAVVSGEVLDAIITDGQTVRSPESGQVVLFFRSSGTGAPLSGLHVAMASAQAAIYKTSTSWVLDDGTAITSSNGLVVFANVDTTNSTEGTQLVTVSRLATATTAAVDGGTFAVKVVADAVTMASVSVQL